MFNLNLNQMKNNFKNFAFGALLFVALLPLSFTFSNGQAHLVFLPHYEWVGWIAGIISAIVLAVFRNSFTKNELIGLSFLFALLPFSFGYSSEGFQFIFLLTSPVLAILYWIAALIPMFRIVNFRLQK
jgi:hypothetical protein